MKKSEVLRASFSLRQAYKCFIGNIDKGILVGNPFMPSNDDIKAFSDYILENDDRNLYDATFGLMNRQLISNAYWRLFEELNIKGLKEKILKDCDGDMKRYYANDVVYMFHSLAAIHREMITLGDIFDASTTDYPNGNNTETLTDGVRLPQELYTDRAIKCFSRAVRFGYMEREGDNYKWLFGGDKGQARLGYFCRNVYDSPRPINKLEEIFGVKKLSASITNADYEAKRADVIQWRNKMDNDIFND